MVRCMLLCASRVSHGCLVKVHVWCQASILPLISTLSVQSFLPICQLTFTSKMSFLNTIVFGCFWVGVVMFNGFLIRL